MINLGQLYAEYGQLMVQSEIVNNKIKIVKQQIQKILNRPIKQDFKEVKIPDKKAPESKPELVIPKKMTAPKKSKKK